MIDYSYIIVFIFQSIFFFLTGKDSRKLTFIYLANDVIQNSRKKGPEFRTG